jgi:hypothetical protein
MNTALAPIAIFAYKRPAHTARLLESLRANAEHASSLIYVFLDGPRDDLDRDDVARTRALVRAQAPGHAVLLERESNSGLAESIIDGVTRLVREHGRVIVLEDDLILSPYALRYFNDALIRYRDVERVMHVAGYMFPVKANLPETFLYREASCWGWATWARAWSRFEPDGRKIRDALLSRGLQREFDVRGSTKYLQMLELQIAGQIDSWAIRWYGSVHVAGGLALHPARALIGNRGFDGTGRHGGETRVYDVQLADRPVRQLTDRIEESEEALEAMIRFRTRLHALPRRIYNRLLRHSRQFARMLRPVSRDR